jgi:hypothetical protein
MSSRSDPLKSHPKASVTEAPAVVDTVLEPDPDPQSEPETEPSDPLDAMHAWVNDLSDEPGEGVSAGDWQRFKSRAGEVSRQTERLLDHGWSLRGLFGWPIGLVAQAWHGHYTFTSLHPDGRVVMTPENGGAIVTVDPIAETDEKCPCEED